MSSTGTVNRFSSGGHDGFIRPDGGSSDGLADVHFSIRGHTPPEMKIIGTRVEYDSIDRPKGPHTDNARVIAAAPTTPIAAPIPAPAPVAPMPDTKPLRVWWGKPRLAADKTLLIAEVFIARGTQPVLDLPVQLIVNGKKFEKPTYLDSVIGSVTYLLPIKPNTKQVGLKAQIGERLYSCVWYSDSLEAFGATLEANLTAPPADSNVATDTHEPAPPASEPVEPPKVAKAIKVLETGTDNEGFTTFEVLTLTEDGPDAEGVPADYTVISSAELEAVESDQVQTARSYGNVTDEDGQDIVPIRPSKPGEATVYFRLTKFPAKLQGPFTVTRKEVVPPATTEPEPPPATEPLAPAEPQAPLKTCKHITAEVVQGDSGFSNILKIKTRTGEDPDASDVACELTLKGMGEGELQIGTQRGRTITVSTDANGRFTEQVFFVQPHHRGRVIIHCTTDPDVSINEPLYIRHPENATRP
ncbi:MAG: hypothetical protein WDN47_04070 [Candidatus Doudnabacteria bacterium]